MYVDCIKEMLRLKSLDIRVCITCLSDREYKHVQTHTLNFKRKRERERGLERSSETLHRIILFDVTLVEEY